MAAPVKDKTPSDDIRIAISGLLRAFKDTYSANTSSLIGFTGTKPYWSICVDKFHSFWASVNKPDQAIVAIEDMFYRFYASHREDLILPIVDTADGSIFDDWLKTEESTQTKWMKKDTREKKKPARRRTDDEYSWSVQTQLKGVVAYFDDEDESMKKIAIPITEGYRTAIAVYKAGAGKKEASFSPLPATILYCLYAICYHICDTRDKPALKRNMDDMYRTVNSLVPEEGTGEGSTLDPMKNMLKMLSKSMGSSIDESKISQMMGSLFSEEVSGKMKKVVEEVSKRVGSTTSADGKTPDISSMMSQMGAVLQETGAQEMIKETIEAATKLSESIPTAGDVPAPDAVPLSPPRTAAPPSAEGVAPVPSFLAAAASVVDPSELT